MNATASQRGGLAHGWTASSRTAPSRRPGTFAGGSERVGEAGVDTSTDLRGWIAAAVAALSAVALYAPAVGYGFVFDDLSLVGADGAPLPLGGALPYRPMRYASYLVDHWLGGSAAVYHANNIAVHALVAGLVVLLARRFGSRSGAALAAGLLVALHPYSVEAAAYVAGRRDSLCVAFGLAALLAHGSRRIGLAAALLFASVASKESGLVFAFPLAAMTTCGVAGASDERRRDLRALAAATVAGLALAVAYGAIGPWTPPLDASGVAMASRVAVHYATGLLGLRGFAAGYPTLAERPADGGWIVAAACVGVAVAAIPAMRALYRGRRGRGAAQLVFLPSLGDSLARTAASPAAPRGMPRVFLSSNVSPGLVVAAAWAGVVVLALMGWGSLHEPGADRHAYLLLPPVGIALALVLTGMTPSVRRAATAAVAVFVVALAVTTTAQMKTWRSERSLWAHAVASGDASVRARSNLARALAADGEYAAAVRELNAAIAADAGNADLLIGRAAIHCASAHVHRARRDLRVARNRGAAAEVAAALASECGLRPLAGGRAMAIAHAEGSPGA